MSNGTPSAATSIEQVTAALEQLHGKLLAKGASVDQGKQAQVEQLLASYVTVTNNLKEHIESLMALQ